MAVPVLLVAVVSILRNFHLTSLYLAEGLLLLLTCVDLFNVSDYRRNYRCVDNVASLRYRLAATPTLTSWTVMSPMATFTSPSCSCRAALAVSPKPAAPPKMPAAISSAENKAATNPLLLI